MRKTRDRCITSVFKRTFVKYYNVTFVISISNTSNTETNLFHNHASVSSVVIAFQLIKAKGIENVLTPLFML